MIYLQLIGAGILIIAGIAFATWFNEWVAGKIGCRFDHKEWKFIHGDFCQEKCWHRKYKKEGE